MIAAEPYQTDVWKGALMPINLQKVGELCKIHHPPHINYDYLEYKVLEIKEK